jgi:hypothetical protein
MGENTRGDCHWRRRENCHELWSAQVVEDIKFIRVVSGDIEIPALNAERKYRENITDPGAFASKLKVTPRCVNAIAPGMYRFEVANLK